VKRTAEYHDLGELYNERIVTRQYVFDINGRPGLITNLMYGKPSARFPERSETLAEFSRKDKLLTNFTEVREPVIFSVLLFDYVGKFDSELRHLASRDDTQFINLTRADVLYSLISAYISQQTEVWHNTSVHNKDRRHTQFRIEMPMLRRHLTEFICEQQFIIDTFKNVPTVYYEEFQHSPANLRNKFTGMPCKIVTTTVNKFSGNHKDFITNLDEVEDFYEQFVNEHKEYFPQYFGKLPHIQIPACQGRQPRDLSRMVCY
jgi:hypothetical protein